MKRSNWATVYIRPRDSTAPGPQYAPPKPEVLPTETPEAVSKKVERDEWLAGIMGACED